MGRRLLPDLLRHHADLRPDVLALLGADGGGLTYREWSDRSTRVAGALIEMGIGSDDLVALVGDNAHYEAVGVAYIGIMLAGAVVLPLDASDRHHEALHAVAMAAPRLVVTCEDRLVTAASCESTTVARLTANATPGRRLPSLRPDAAAELLSTSGTTGLPRLVEASHANLSQEFEIEPRSDPAPYFVLHALRPGTNVGQVALRSSLTLGYSVVALEQFDLDRYLRLAGSLPMRGTMLVPAMAAAIAAEAHRRGWSSDAAEVAVVTGAATPSEVWRRLAGVFPNAQLVNSYSTTEAWPARTVAVVDPDRPDSVGRPLDRQAVEIRDEGGGRLSPFEVGTVHLQDRGAAPRRYADGTPSVTTAGWVATDDLGYVDDEGFLFIVDRKSDVITTGGHTVSTLEVEGVLVQHPQVVEAAVVGVAHPTLGSYVAACVVGPPTLDLEDVQRQARRQLAPHKVPRILQRRDVLPFGRSGKVAKSVLRQELAAHELRARAQPAETDELSIRVIWEQVLERPVPGVDSSFFALGGDSLSALRVVSRIQDELVDAVPTECLLAASTIAEQAAIVAATRARA